MRRHGSWLLCAALAAPALAGASGCAAPVAHVTRGETLATGDAAFDDFFTAVREARTEALAAQADEQALHAALIKALGLEPKTATSAVVDESGVRAKRFQEKGLLLHLEIAPEARLVIVRAKWDPGPDGEALLKAVEGAAKASLDMRRRLAAVAGRAVELERRRVELRGQAPATFRDGPQAKRDEIVFELDAAHGVLADVGDRAGNAAGAAARFVVELAQAVETGAGAADARLAKGGKRPGAPSPAAVFSLPATAPATASRPAPAAARPAAASPAPAAARPAPAAPAPGKKSKGGGDDFEP